ncbi:MAG: hypothetical protein ACYC7A_04075 [Thermoanaerobaculia bacterium]
MDHAVSLVQAYLQLNGYFTAAEYPVMQANGRGGFRTTTDIDILAFRFPTPGDAVLPTGRGAKLRGGFESIDTDPGLDVPHDRIDLVVGEVKEGRVDINSGSRDPAVLRTVMSRFGCAPDDIDAMADGLLRDGAVTTLSGYQVRLIAFGAMPPGTAVPPCRIISLGHVLSYLHAYVRKNWQMLRHCQFKDPAFGFLMTIEKAKRGGAGRRGKAGVEVVSAEGANGSGRRTRPRDGAERRGQTRVERIAKPRPRTRAK